MVCSFKYAEGGGKTMIKAILFDLDGTIVNTNNLILKSFEYIFKEYLKMSVSREEIYANFGVPLKQIFEKHKILNVDEAVEEYIRYNLRIHDEYIENYDHVESGLAALREKGFKLAIVTSKFRDTALRGLRCFDLEKYFDLIITPEDTEFHKPHPAPVLAACEKLNIKPEEAIMVGDSHNDILAGKNAGSKTCAVKYTDLNYELLLESNPDFSIDTIDELVTIASSN